MPKFVSMKIYANLPDNKRGGRNSAVVLRSYGTVVHRLWLCLCNCVSI